LSWNFPTLARNSAFSPEGDVTGDYVDWQFRIGFHPGVRVYVAPVPPPQPPPELPAPQNRPPSVRARCEPCTVEVGRSVTVTADAQDPDGDTLTYRWSAPAGAFQSAANRQTQWTAPQQEGPVPITVTVSDGHGGTASDNVTVQVLRTQPIVELTFEDVFFDFDRSTLRPDALRLLDEVVAVQANPGRNIIIEGHTCSIGTAEYNCPAAAREQRPRLPARAGSGGEPMETRSYGESGRIRQRLAKRRDAPTAGRRWSSGSSRWQKADRAKGVQALFPLNSPEPRTTWNPLEPLCPLAL
jgi:outer membrane protein OmpA-like peptidoglycan-associated protein